MLVQDTGYQSNTHAEFVHCLELDKSQRHDGAFCNLFGRQVHDLSAGVGFLPCISYEC
jgi:hypothetical protein